MRSPRSQLQNLKAVGSDRQVVTIHHDRDTLEVRTADGRSAVFQAVDLRFKVDSSDNGPPAGRPVILPGGMMGDRATVFFASAAEISDLIRYQG
jgi:cytochrome c